MIWLSPSLAWRASASSDALTFRCQSFDMLFVPTYQPDPTKGSLFTSRPRLWWSTCTGSTPGAIAAAARMNRRHFTTLDRSPNIDELAPSAAVTTMRRSALMFAGRPDSANSSTFEPLRRTLSQRQLALGTDGMVAATFTVLPRSDALQRRRRWPCCSWM